MKIVFYGALLDEAEQMASKIARKPGQALKSIALSANGGRRTGMKTAVAWEASFFEMIFRPKIEKRVHFIPAEYQ